MIDLTGTGPTTAMSPPVAAERRDEGGPAFAILLAQASVARAGAPMPPPVPEPVAATDAGPMQPSGQEREEVPIRRAAVDHAIRFDARGMIAMADPVPADPVPAGSDMPAIARPLSPDAATMAATPPVPFDTVASPVAGTVHDGAGMASAIPVGRATPPRPSPLPGAAPATATGEALPTPPLRPDEPEVAIAPAVRRRTRFATMAQGAPKVAVVALADGLAVSAAVGALPDSERHRMRDTIAATLSRHGLRPRAVTLLAMPALATRRER